MQGILARLDATIAWSPVTVLGVGNAILWELVKASFGTCWRNSGGGFRLKENFAELLASLRRQFSEVFQFWETGLIFDIRPGFDPTAPEVNEFGAASVIRLAIPESHGGRLARCLDQKSAFLFIP